MAKAPQNETIEQLWQGFSARALARDAPDVQMKECRRVFYAGAFALLTELTLLAEKSDDEGVAQLDRWLSECNGFFEAIRKGQA